MTTVLKDSGTKTFDEIEVQDLIINGNATITGTINNSTSLEIGTPTFIINGGAGDTKLQIKADTDNSGETDNPIIELIQDGDGINSTIGIGTLSGQTNGNALIFSNAVPAASQFTATGGIMFKSGRTGDVSTSSERLLIHPDGDVKVLSNLDVAGNIILGDDNFIKFGAGNDLQIGHDPDRNFIYHSKQLQFKSTMTSGDGYKFLETGQRLSKFLFGSNNASGSEKSNYYFTFGNDDTDATDRSYMLERIRRQDGAGLHTIIEKSQVGNTVDTAVVDTLCKAKFSNDVNVVDGKSIFLGDSNDLQLIHSTNSFIDEQGGGDLYIRTNGVQIAISDTTSSTNYMARFIKDAAVELYHNKSKKFETTSTGITITGEIISTTNTIVAPSLYMNDPIVNSTISKIDGIIITTIFMNFSPASGQSIQSSQAAANAIISKADASPGASAITQITSAKNGTIFKVEMNCIETPSSLTDVDLVYASTVLSGGTTSGQTILLNTGGLSIGKSYENLSPGDLSNKFLHLSNGAGSSSTDTQTAGKIIIRLFGATFD